MYLRECELGCANLTNSVGGVLSFIKTAPSPKRMMKAGKYVMVGSDLLRSQLLQLNKCYKND